MKRRVFVDTRPVSFEETGAGASFLLVHGAGANRNYWKALARDLGDVHTVVPDLYGHGETPPWLPGASPRAAYAYADDVELLEQVAERLAPPLTLVGHSSGGAVCLEYTRRHPDRVGRLVVAEPMLPTALAARFPAAFAEVRAAYESAHDAVAQGEPETAARRLFEYILGDGEWQRLADGTRAWMTQNVAITLAAHSRASLALAVEPGRYAGVRCPVLLLCGERTRTPFRLVCEELAATLPGARLEVVAGAAHNAPATHAKEVGERIVRFVSAASPSPRGPDRA